MPSGSHLTKEMRSKGGRKKGNYNTRRKQWEELSEYMTNHGAERVIKALSKLSDEDFLVQYGKLLNYFKPKQVQSSQTIEHNLKGPAQITFGDNSKDDNKS